MNNIKKTDLTKSLPPILKENKDIQALSKLIAAELDDITSDIDKNIIFADISNADEETLDILAYDLNVLWYDYRYELEVKRSIIKDCIKVYRKLGTPYAVIRSISNVFPESDLKEWFEYGGDPYTFKIEINATKNGAPEELQKIALERIRFYKNLRSHLESITYLLESKAAITTAAASTTASTISIYPYANKEVEVTGEVNVVGTNIYKQEIKIYPYLVNEINKNTNLEIMNCIISRIDINIQPRKEG